MLVVDDSIQKKNNIRPGYIFVKTMLVVYLH